VPKRVLLGVGRDGRGEEKERLRGIVDGRGDVRRGGSSRERGIGEHRAWARTRKGETGEGKKSE